MKYTSAAICLLIAFSLICIPSIAQPPETLWTQTFGGIENDMGTCVQQTTDEGYIIVGNTDSFGAGYRDLWMIKTDADGNELWSQTFGGTDADGGNNVQQTSDGGYIVTGYYSSYLWLIKTDSNGNELWSQTFGGTEGDEGSSVQQTLDGGYIITGGTNSFGAGGMDVWLIKTDTNGIEQWSQTFGGIDNERGYSVKQTTDGGYIITGGTLSFGAGVTDVWIIKTDADGNEIWSHTFGGAFGDYGYDVEQTTDGGYIIFAGTSSIGAGFWDVWLIKTDTNGNEVWSQTFGGTGLDYGRSGQQLPDGGYIVAGRTESFGAGSYDIWLIKTDSAGNELWSKTLGGAESEWSGSVSQTTDGGYVVNGSTESFGAGAYDSWLVRVAADGTEVTEDLTTSPTDYLLDEIYPNPFNPTATISISLPKPSELRITVANTLGQEVAVLADGQYTQGYQQLTFDATGLSSGIYFVHATVPGQMNEMRKIVYMK